MRWMRSFNRDDRSLDGDDDEDSLLVGDTGLDDMTGGRYVDYVLRRTAAHCCCCSIALAMGKSLGDFRLTVGLLISHLGPTVLVLEKVGLDYFAKTMLAPAKPATLECVCDFARQVDQNSLPAELHVLRYVYS